MFCATQRTTELFRISTSLNSGIKWTATYLTITSALASTFAMPKYSVGIGYPGTTYLSTKTVYITTISTHPPKTPQTRKKILTTLPAIPPAKSANPKNSTNRAFHATPLPE